MISDALISKPSDSDVVFGSGKIYDSHKGNRCFKQIIESRLDEYCVSSKIEKSLMISALIQHFTRRSHQGRFVRLNPQTGEFDEVGDHYLREKISQAFRDALHFRYKSSKIARKEQRKTDRSFRYQIKYKTLRQSMSNPCTFHLEEKYVLVSHGALSSGSTSNTKQSRIDDLNQECSATTSGFNDCQKLRINLGTNLEPNMQNIQPVSPVYKETKDFLHNLEIHEERGQEDDEDLPFLPFHEIEGIPESFLQYIPIPTFQE